MKYINVKKMVAVISAGFILISISGCKKQEEISYSNIPGNSSNQYVETELTEETQKLINENDNEEIVTYFEDLEQQVDDCLNESNFDKLKEKAKNIAITGIDFIFYGKEIKGVTFEELTEETKNKIMYIVASVDSKIESKIPGYKETIKDKFGQGYDYVSEKLQEGLNYVDGKLEEKYGDDYMNAKDKATDIKDDVKENASNIYDKVTEEIESGWSKIKEWYEEKTNKG